MRLFVLFQLFCIVFMQSINAQITVGQNDMPSAGDTVYYGTSAISNFDPLQTGASFTWDFSDLTALNNRSDTFLTIAQTPVIYNVVFNLLIANLACINQSPPSFGGGITVTDYYDFYKKSSSGYKKIGFGASINGVYTPVKYDFPELYYTFPLNYADADSSVSSYGMSIPSNGYFGQTINRKFNVDGWGILIIPYGTFQVLRVKTTLNITDTIYSETFQFGYNIDRPIAYEYYWIANNLKGHALKISKNGMANTAEFLDSLSYSNINISNIEPLIEVYPNPVNDKVYFNLNGEKYNIIITNMMGQVVFSATTSEKTTVIETSHYTAGVYCAKIVNKSHYIVKKFIVSR